MKKVTFGAKRPSTVVPAPGIDDWVNGGAPESGERTKRLTIDVPMSLHKRIKSQCAMENLVMADVIRDLLQHRFPAQSTEREQGAPS